VKTFADMARRYCENDGRLEAEHLQDGSLPLAGVVRLQPNRKGGNKPWQTEPASEPREGSDLRYSQDSEASLIVECTDIMADCTNAPTNSGTLAEACQESSPIDTHPASQDHYTELFGRLPDPIRLHEQLGEFDGQVIFIAHPNRDVSAHQWSSTFFQWENIGRYTYSRGRVEGSLASDRLKADDTSRNSLAYFKLAAEGREKLIMENVRSKNELAEIDRATSTHGARGSLTQISSTLAIPESTTSSLSKAIINSTDVVTPQSASLTSHVATGRGCLDDPFIVDARPVGTIVANSNPTEPRTVDLTGSLNLEYQFPLRLSLSSASVARQTLPHDQVRGYKQMSHLTLREVRFGEEASDGSAPEPLQCGLPLQESHPKEDIPTRQNIRSPSAEHTRFMNVPPQQRNALSTVGKPLPSAHSLFPPPGLTVANPRRNVTALEHTAPNYAKVTRTAPSPETLAPDFIAANNFKAAALQFSDPDGIRQAQEYEIANGLSQQAPTPQNFKGPFFTESKPTVRIDTRNDCQTNTNIAWQTHDPTVSLAVHIDEEEKLINWFRDGHRPLRQREYAQSLVFAAANGGKGRHAGAVNDTLRTAHTGLYDNTAPFVRLYEEIFGYIDECRNDSGGSYFTRNWKVADPHLRDLRPDGSE
jgi:hypothetical protein